MGVSSSISSVSSYSYNSTIQDSKNITQYNSEVICNASCTGSISNIYLTIENSNVGNISFDQECEAELDCYQKNDIEIINNVQMTNTQVSETTSENVVKQPLLGISTSLSIVESTSKNYSLASSYNATYINVNMGCVSTSINEISDVVIIIKDSNTGDVDFVQKGSATTSCQSVNSAKVTNTVSLVNDQTAISESSNTVGGLGLAGLIVLLVIAFIIIAVIRGLSNKSKNSSQESCNPEPGKQLPPNCLPPPGFVPPPYPLQMNPNIMNTQVTSSNIDLNPQLDKISNYIASMNNKVPPTK